MQNSPGLVLIFLWFTCEFSSLFNSAVGVPALELWHYVYVVIRSWATTNVIIEQLKENFCIKDVIYIYLNFNLSL